MKTKWTELAIALFLLAPISPAFAQSFEPCEKYEYAELKALSQKQLQLEYCKVERHTNEIYKAIGYATADNKDDEALIVERNNCWQVAEKMGRQPMFKKISTTCPDVVRIKPIDAAVERATANAEKSAAALRRTLNATNPR